MIYNLHRRVNHSFIFFKKNQYMEQKPHNLIYTCSNWNELLIYTLCIEIYKMLMKIKDLNKAAYLVHVLCNSKCQISPN